MPDAPARFQVTPLASGSQGNAVLVHAGDRLLLVDAGLPVDTIEERLAAVDVRARQVDALLLTHRHRDHIRGAADFVRRHKTRVISTRRTLRSLPNDLHRRYHAIVPGTPRAVGAVQVLAFALSHDAPDTVGFRLNAENRSYGHATDLGRFDDGVVSALTHCHELYLEFNHDRQLLNDGPYPPLLKRRIASDWGHLANDSAADLLRELSWPGLEHVFLAHLSQHNNRPELALDAARRALLGTDALPRLTVARQEVPTPASEPSAEP